VSALRIERVDLHVYVFPWPLREIRGETAEETVRGRTFRSRSFVPGEARGIGFVAHPCHLVAYYRRGINVGDGYHRRSESGDRSELGVEFGRDAVVGVVELPVRPEFADAITDIRREFELQIVGGGGHPLL